MRPLMAHLTVSGQPPRRPPTGVLPGRQFELALIEREFERALEGEPRFIFLTGETGVGKTRLLRHAAREARMLPVGLYLPPEMVGPEDLMEHWLAPLLLLPLLKTHHLDLSIAAAIYPRLAALVPQAKLPTSRAASPPQAVAAICRLLADAAEQTPLLLLLDDLPRVQPEARGLIAQIAGALMDAPIAFLGTARSDDDSLRDRAVAQLLDVHLLRRIEVKPLDQSALGDLIRMEYDDSIVPKLLPWLHAKSLGNPLFATELLRALEAQGILQNGTGTWRINGRLETLAIPHTIGHLLEARRKRLPPELAELVPMLALLGPDAPAAVLAAASDLEESTLAEQCDRLVELGLLERSGDTYVFSHPLMAEEYRRRLNKHQQRDVAHRALGVILGDIASRASYRPPLQNGASETGLEDAIPAEVRRILAYAEAEGNAVQASLAAIELGRRCLDGRRPREAAGWSRYATQRAARVASRHDRNAIRTQIDLLVGTALYQTGRMPAARRRLARVAAAYERLDPENQRKAFTYLGLLYCRTGRFSEARRTFEAGYEALNRLGLSPDEASILSCGFLNQLAWNELRRGDFEAAEQFLERAASALGDSPSAKSGRALTQLLTYRGLLWSGLGEYKRTVAELERALEVSMLHLPHTSRSAESNLALALVHVGDLVRAREITNRILQIETADEDGAGKIGPLICLGNIAEMASEWSQAINAYEEALRLAERFDNFNPVLAARMGLITAYEVAGNSAMSDHVWTQAVTMQQRPLATSQLGTLFLSRATALAHRRDWPAVEQIASDWIPKLSARQYRREAATMEMLGIRATLERLKDDQSATDTPGFPAEAALIELWRRLSSLEEYLRGEGLRGLLVDFDRMQLHLALAGLQEISIEAVLQDLIDHLRFMGATARLAEIAEEFSDTAISIRSLYRQVFEPARSVTTPPRTQLRSEASSVRPTTAFSEATDSRTRIFTFGRLRVIPAGCSQPLTRAQWASKRARVLLAYLLAKDLEGRGVTREEVWEAVWPDSESFDLTNAFHITMVRLRSALRRGHDGSEGSSIIFADGLYRLATDDISCDARQFDREIRQAETFARDGHREESLRARQAAFDLYEGEFLADTDEIWAEARRERFRTRFLECGRELVKAGLEEGRIRDARRIGEKVLASDSEEGHRLLDLLHSTDPSSK